MKSDKIRTTFEDNILTVRFLDGAIITEYDLVSIYKAASRLAKGEKFGVIFQALGTYNVTEEAIHYMVDNPHNNQVLKKIYVVDSAEAALKTKLHLKFDKPHLLPLVAKSAEEAMAMMKEIMEKKQD